MSDDFAGRTPTGGKIHRCFTRHSSGCSYTMRSRIPYFRPISGQVKRADLCIKCWGEAPSTEYLRGFGIEVIS